MSSSSKTLSSKQEASERARNTTEVDLEPKLALQNEISCLIESFAETGNKWYLEKLSSLLEQVDKDLVNMPPISNKAMLKFFDSEEVFAEGDAALMVKELAQLWPDFKEIDAADLEVLKEGLVKFGLYLEYGFLRPFLAVGVFLIRERREAGGALSDVAEKAVEIVRLVHEDYKPSADSD